MEMHQLRYFVAVAEAGNFTAGAKRSFISQPSLSLQIQKLEDELGQRLFQRLGRRAVLTEAGRFFYDRARTILLEVENTRRELAGDESPVGREVLFGCISTVAPYLVPPVLEQCQRAHSDLDIRLFESLRGPLIESVHDGEIDFAIISLLNPLGDMIEVEPLLKERLLTVLPAKHPLARKKHVDIDALVQERFILLGEASSLTAQVKRFFGDQRVEPSIACRCAQVKTVKSLVAAGLGVSILPTMAISEATDAGLVYRPIKGHSPTRQLALIRHRQRFLNRGARAFINVLKEFCASGHPILAADGP